MTETLGDLKEERIFTNCGKGSPPCQRLYGHKGKHAGSGFVILSTPEWCMALHGNHDEHQCHKKPGHEKRDGKPDTYDFHHECYCGVWW